MKNCILIFIISFVLMLGVPVVASELAPKVSFSETVKNHPTPIKLSVRDSSAGIRTDYYEQILVEEINANTFFSSNDVRRYSLDIRIINVTTPSFGKRMTASIKAVWKFHCTAKENTLLEKTILSTYTGKTFEGGIIGANRVRAATHGAMRESVRIGMKALSSLELNKMIDCQH